MIGASSLTVALGSFAVAFAATHTLVKLLGHKRMLDTPNERSSHSTPVPRGGGLGIVLGLLAGLLIAWQAKLAAPNLGLLAGTLLIAGCGLWDDLKRAPVWLRLLVQTIAAIVFLLGTDPIQRLPLPAPMDLPLGLAARPFCALWIVGAVNIYNFLDGIDGFAGLQGVIAGVAIACMQLSPASEALGLAIAGASLGFLIFNWHPARIFMGDLGSTTIGFLLASIPFQLEGARQHEGVFLVGMCLWFFLVDGTFTLIKRLLRHERVWEAHRSHLYQQLVIAGVPHNVVTIRVGLMSAVVAGMTVLAARSASIPLHWCTLALASTGFLVYVRWARQASSHHV